MEGPTTQGGAGAAATTWDHVALELQRLRTAAGSPSYATVAQLVADRRLARGDEPHGVRIARSTVYDCFRTGRARVNRGLVAEIAQALGADLALVDGWFSPARADPTEPVPEPAPAPAPVLEQPEQAAARPWGAVLLLLVACVGLNLLGRAFEELLGLPVYLDMIGTAVVALALGPWRGAAVGATTNLVGVVASGAASIPFALVNVVGALLWGYGVRRWGLGRTLPRFFALNLLVALGCTLTAAPILLLLYGGSTGHGQDAVTATLMTMTHQHALSTFLSDLLVSVGDKVITGFVALVAVVSLPAVLRPREQTALPDPASAVLLPGVGGPTPG